MPETQPGIILKSERSTATDGFGAGVSEVTSLSLMARIGAGSMECIFGVVSNFVLPLS
jgi:hypothetical protein